MGWHGCGVGGGGDGGGGGKKIRDLIEEEDSRWVLHNIQRINSIFGVTFDGLREQIMEPFKEIEKRKLEKVKGQRLKVKAKNREGIESSRELRRLQSSINYDNSRKGRTEGRESIWRCLIHVWSQHFWNVGGINDHKKRLVIRDWMNRWKLDVICL